MGGLCCFFKKSTSISDYIHFCDSDSLLATLTTLFRKTTHKMYSLVTTLTTLIYIKNSFITGCAVNDDIQDNMKNSFNTEFANYPVFNTRWEMISSLTTLTTLICKATLKIISSSTMLITLICKTTLRIISSSTTLTTLICKTTLKIISWSTTRAALICKVTLKMISALTTLTTLIIKITWKTALSLIQLTTLIYWLHWLRWYIDYADYADILTTLTTLIYWLHWLRWYIDYTDYADILTTLTTLIYWMCWLRWYSTLHEKQFHHRLHWLRCYERLLLIKHSSMATLIFKSNSHGWLRWLPTSTYNN